MITILNEKRSQAQLFAYALGDSQTAFTGVIPVGPLKGQHYQIVWAAGHLYEFKDLKDMVPEDEQDNYTNWDYNVLPFDRTKISWQKQVKSGNNGPDPRRYLKDIKAALNKSDTVVIATDNDPSGEGDLLGWEILEANNFDGTVYRCLHDTEEKPSVLKAFKNLKLISNKDNSIRDGKLFKAKAREKFDFLTIQYVRVITDLAAKKQVLPPGSVPREGRLKSAIVELIGTSEFKHANFKPHSTYVPALRDDDGNVFINDSLSDSENKGDVDLTTIPSDSVSVEIDTKKTTKKVPKLYDLAQVGAKLDKAGKASLKQSGKLAETLYQAHYLSYPRTEDHVIAPDQLAALIPLVDKIASVVGVDLQLLDKNDFKKYLIGSGAHGANRPGTRVPTSLDALDEEFGKGAGALYEELARSFLAGFAKEKVVQKHVYADSSTKKFKYSVTETLEPGYDLVLGNDVKFAKLPKVGSNLKPIVHEKKATRPSLATSDTISAYLKKNNIGTGATRLDTLAEISDSNPKRQLVANKRGKLTLTKLGQLSFLGMQGTYLANPQMTKNLEGYLNKIEKGTITEKQLLGFFDTLFENDKKQIIENGKLYDNLEKIKVKTHTKVSGLFNGQSVNISDTWGDHKFSKEELDKLFNGDDIQFKYTNGAMVTGHLAKKDKYPLGFVATDMKYPKPESVKGVYVPTGEEIEFQASFSRHTFSKDEIKELLLGNDVSFPAQGKKGKYTAVVKLIFGPGYKDKTDKWRITFANNKKGKSKVKKK